MSLSLYFRRLSTLKTLFLFYSVHQNYHVTLKATVLSDYTVLISYVISIIGYDEPLSPCVCFDKRNTEPEYFQFNIMTSNSKVVYVKAALYFKLNKIGFTNHLNLNYFKPTYKMKWKLLKLFFIRNSTSFFFIQFNVI